MEDSNRVHVTSIRCRWERFIMEIFGETVASMRSDQVLGLQVARGQDRLQVARGQHRLDIKSMKNKD